ncbi:hypothetical protein KAR52_01040 [Candidatus Pacearchaeota archaeon]|nr:hypothetical protein [Candidatus Pacearchaeota archaeon]
MKKSCAVLGLLIVSILLISSVSFIFAEVNETEADICATSISVNFNEDVYYEGDFFKVTIEVLDSQGNPLPNYPFYISIYSYPLDIWEESSTPEYTNEQGYYEHSAEALMIIESGKFLYKVYTEETASCPKVEDTAEIEVISKETTETAVEEVTTEEPEPTAPTTCAARITVNFDKNIYYIGDTAEIMIEVFDSQGNHIPNYPFYNQMYDDRWHTPGLEKTDNNGYFKAQPTVEKEQSKLGEIKFKVYTSEYSNCNSVENFVMIEIRQRGISEPVPCGIGTCIPEEEIDEVKAVPEDQIFYACNGCELEGKCYPMGYRKNGQYCSDNNEFIKQSRVGTCDNSFECQSNVCVSGECVGEGLIKRILAWFRKLFGGDEDEEPGLKMCSKLLIEKDIKDYEYVQSEYGVSEHTQAPLFSEDGEYLDVIKCCAVEYIHEDKDVTKKEERKATIVCPYGNREDLRNSLKWILAKEGMVGETELDGHKVLGNMNEVIIWTHDTYLVASGGDPRSGTQIAEEVAKAYLKKYPSDLDIDLDEVPDVEPDYGKRYGPAIVQYQEWYSKFDGNGLSDEFKFSGKQIKGDIKLDFIEGRGEVSITQYPTEENGFETIILFDDDKFGDADYYKIKLLSEAGEVLFTFGDCIDGSDYLIIRDNTVQYRHREYQNPGEHESCAGMFG